MQSSRQVFELCISDLTLYIFSRYNALYFFDPFILIFSLLIKLF